MASLVQSNQAIGRGEIGARTAVACQICNQIQPVRKGPSGDREMRANDKEYPWFAVQVRTRYENMAATVLRGKGYESFLPLYKSRRRWSDRIKEVQLPLFPGYLFCRLDPQNRLPVLTTPGVIQIVGVGRTPMPLDEYEAQAIRTVVESGLTREPWPFLQVGNRVRIECGPLTDLEGILLAFKGQYRIVLSVTLLQRSVAVEVDRAWVSCLSSEQVARADCAVPARTRLARALAM
jgi:transcription antitermination factor NusG